MSDRPEKLYLSAPDADQEHEIWFDPDEGGTEYVRADLYAALEAQLAEVREIAKDAEMMIGAGYGVRADKLVNMIFTALEATPPAPKVTEALAVAHEALEAASDQILEDYRIWVADDKDAKPRYGQYPRYDQVNAAIRIVSVALTAAQEAGKP